MSTDAGHLTRASAVTIGTYDGVHLGHRQLIAETVKRARELNASAVVVTFDHHPAAVLRPERAPKLLTGLGHKLELIRATEIDDVVVLRFDEERSKETAEDFVERVLVGELRARAVVVGTNFHFGNGQRGDLELLEKMGGTFGFSAIGLDLVTDDAQGSEVSSSRIRVLVAQGELEEASRLLGRDHEVRGVAVELAGALEGALGVVIPGRLCLPPPGAYWAQLGAPGAAELPALVDLGRPSATLGGESVVTIRPRPGDPERFGAPWPATGTRCAVRFVAPYGRSTA